MNLLDRKELLERAKIAKAKKIADGAHFRRDFADSNYWDKLAKELQIRLPAWYQPATPGQMAKWVRKLELTYQECKDVFGDDWVYSDYVKQNNHHGLRPFVGLLLEIKLS